jgi:hypothetical protein
VSAVAPVVCVDCEYRVAEPGSMTYGASGDVLDAVCAKCAVRRGVASGVQRPGTVLVGGVARAFHKGLYNREIV